MVKMVAIQLLTVLWMAHCSHGFVVQRPVVKIFSRNKALLAESPNKDTSNDAPPSTSFVQPSFKKSTVISSPSIMSSDTVANVTNAALKEDSFVPPTTKKSKPLTPVEKANLALEKQATGSVDKETGRITEKKPNDSNQSQSSAVKAGSGSFSNAGIGVMAPKAPPKQAESPIYNRPKVPPLEQMPSKTNAFKDASGDVISEKMTMPDDTSNDADKKDTVHASIIQQDKTVSAKAVMVDKDAKENASPVVSDQPTTIFDTEKDVTSEPVQPHLGPKSVSEVKGNSDSKVIEPNESDHKQESATTQAASLASHRGEVQGKKEVGALNDKAQSSTATKNESEVSAASPISDSVPSSITSAPESTVAAPSSKATDEKLNPKALSVATGTDETNEPEAKDKTAEPSTKAAFIASPNDGSVQVQVDEKEPKSETPVVKADKSPSQQKVSVTKANYEVGSSSDSSREDTVRKADASPKVSKTTEVSTPIPDKATTIPEAISKPVKGIPTPAAVDTESTASSLTAVDAKSKTKETSPLQDGIPRSQSSKVDKPPTTKTTIEAAPKDVPSLATGEEKTGLGAITDLFFGSSETSNQDDAEVLNRIRERKQAQVDESGSLSAQLQAAKDELEAVKLESEQAIAELRVEAEETQLLLRQEVNELAVKLEVAESFSERSRARMQEMAVKQVELDSEAKEWKELHARDSPLWAAKYERERDYRRREQIEARERLSQVMKDSAEKLARAREEGRKREDMIREDLTRVLEQNKRTLSYTTVELKQAKAALMAQDAKIEALGDDRDSLRQLAREAISLIKERTKKRWNKVKSRIAERNRNTKKE